MSAYYLDSSALVKFYIPETGSVWVDALVNAQTPTGEREATCTIVKIGLVEVAAAFARRQRMGDISCDQQTELYDRLIQDAQNLLETVAVDDSTVAWGMELTQRHPLRGYDAIHLAAALRLGAILVAAGLPAPVFVSADANLCAVAQAEGLATENPNDHP